MPVDTQDGIPAFFYAGETVRFTIGWDDYPATAWTLAFNIKSGAAFLTVAGVASGNDFIVTLTKAQTAALIPGIYAATAVLTETAVTAESFVESEGTIRVRPSVLVSTVGPRRLAFEAARTAMEGLAAKKFSSVSVEGESYTLQSIGELTRLVSWLEQQALEEDAAYGLPVTGGLTRIQMRM